MAETRKPVQSIDIKVWRPNEYTTWWRRPRREAGPGWSAFAWGCFRVGVNR